MGTMATNELKWVNKHYNIFDAKSTTEKLAVNIPCCLETQIKSVSAT